MRSKKQLHAFFVTFFFLIIFNVSSVFGATVSGTITDGSGTGVENLGVTVYTSSYNGCGIDQSYSTQTNAEGVYTVNDVTTGVFYIQTNSGDSGLTKEFWATGSSVPDCNTAQTFLITSSDQTETGKNFQLETEATIAGRILDNQGAPIANITVSANLVDNPCHWNTSGNGYVYSDNDGYYTITGLAVGTYYVATQDWSTGYIEEKWANDGSVQDCTNADPVTINTPGQDEIGKDFLLEVGATISGTVTDSNGQPIANLPITLYDSACGWDQKGSAWTDADGIYTVTGLPTGTYYIATAQGTAYIPEWWADGASVQDCSNAVSVPVDTPAQNISSKNFQLELGATISGTVVDEAGQGILNLQITLYDSACGWTQKGSTMTDSNGNYSIGGLPTGTYYIVSNQWDSIYISEWWADGASVQDCNSAVPVIINTAGQNAEGKDFQLELGATISGTVTDDTGQPIAALQVTLYDMACGGGNWKGSAFTNSNGEYTLVGLLPGTFYIQTETGAAGYLVEWWAAGASVQGCNNAEPVTIDAVGQNIDSKTFQLELGATVSGRITDSTGAAVANLKVSANPQFYDCSSGGMGWILPTATTNNNGDYTILGLQTGSYLLEADTFQTDYIKEWWANTGSVQERSLATFVSITVNGQIKTNINFQLELGVSVSGVLTNAGGETVSNAFIYAVKGDIVCSFEYSQNGTVDGDGNYLVRGLAPGNYFIKAAVWPGDSVNYIGEWWSNSGDAYSCNNAEVISVASASLTGKDIQFDAGATISGRITDTSGDPLSNISIHAINTNDPCDGSLFLSNNVVYGYSTLTGEYSLTGLAPGNYYLSAENWENEYVGEWYTDAGGTNNCSSALPITVQDQEVIEDKNFQLDQGGTISGIIYEADGITPLNGNVNIQIFSSDPCSTSEWTYEAYSYFCTGQYTTPALPPGDYYLSTYSQNNDYSNEWWASPKSTSSCSAAQQITVYAGVDTPDKNFQLNQKYINLNSIFMLLLKDEN